LAPVLALFFLSLLSGAEEPCKDARNAYEALSLEDALARVDRELADATPKPIACLEVKALSLIVLGRLDEARAVLVEIFSRDPDDALVDPSLSPAQRATIDGIRESLQPLKASVRARWLVRESIRIDVMLQGGLRGANRVRINVETEPDQRQPSAAEIPLVGSVATATVSVPSAVEVSRIRVAGSVFASADGLLDFSSELLLDQRPEPPKTPEPEPILPTWLLWSGIGAAAIGALLAVVFIAQPKPPNASGTLGELNVNR
jgi:hypothetical protein